LSGATTWQLLALGEVVAPLRPSHIGIERVMAPAGDPLDTMDVAGVGMLAVERGALVATVRQGFAQATSAVVLRTGAVGPGAASVMPGKRRVIREGGALFILLGTTVDLAAGSDDPMTVLVVRVEQTALATPAAVIATPAP
jgi:hypothetical protein